MATKKTAAKTKAAPAKKTHGARGVKIGVGVAAGVAAAIAGAYLMYAKSAAPQRKQAKIWIEKARKDVARELGKLKQVTPSEYAAIIDKAMKRYASMKDASVPELIAAAKEMKGEWKNIQAHATKIAKSTGVKKAAPKKAAAKKTVK